MKNFVGAGPRACPFSLARLKRDPPKKKSLDKQNHIYYTVVALSKHRDFMIRFISFLAFALWASLANADFYLAVSYLYSMAGYNP